MERMKNRDYYLEGLEVIKEIETKNYILAGFRYENENKEGIILIEKPTGENICELYKEKDGSLVGGELSKEADWIFEHKRKGLYKPIKNPGPYTPSSMLRSEDEALEGALYWLMRKLETDLERLFNEA